MNELVFLVQWEMNCWIDSCRAFFFSLSEKLPLKKKQENWENATTNLTLHQCRRLTASVSPRNFHMADRSNFHTQFESFFHNFLLLTRGLAKKMSLVSRLGRDNFRHIFALK